MPVTDEIDNESYLLHILLNEHFFEHYYLVFFGGKGEGIRGVLTIVVISIDAFLFDQYYLVKIDYSRF